jgi:hypothetical protein
MHAQKNKLSALEPGAMMGVQARSGRGVGKKLEKFLAWREERKTWTYAPGNFRPSWAVPPGRFLDPEVMRVHLSYSYSVGYLQRGDLNGCAGSSILGRLGGRVDTRTAPRPVVRFGRTLRPTHRPPIWPFGIFLWEICHLATHTYK